MAVNPASTDFPLTEARAQGILASAEQAGSGNLPQEPWILPVALFAGSLQLPYRDEAMNDPVLALPLPGLQERGYGVLSVLGAWRMWEGFNRQAHSDADHPAAWAPAFAFLIGEQTLRELTQAAAGKHYGLALAALLPRIRLIREGLHIHGLDARYSALGSTQIVLRDSS